MLEMLNSGQRKSAWRQQKGKIWYFKDTRIIAFERSLGVSMPPADGAFV